MGAGEVFKNQTIGSKVTHSADYPNNLSNPKFGFLSLQKKKKVFCNGGFHKILPDNSQKQIHLHIRTHSVRNIAAVNKLRKEAV